MKALLGWIKARWMEPSTRNAAALNLYAIGTFTPFPYSWWLIAASVILGGHTMITRDLHPQPPKE